MSGRHGLSFVLIRFRHLTLPLFNPSFRLLRGWRSVRPLIEAITLALTHKLTVCCYDITKCHTRHVHLVMQTPNIFMDVPSGSARDKSEEEKEQQYLIANNL